MGTSETLGTCAIDKLLTKIVPHILEKIFFSLDYGSFKNCMEVSRSWNDLLISERFQKEGKSVFRKNLEKELWLASDAGNADDVRRIFSNFMVDVNCVGKRYHDTPLSRASCWGHKDVVKLLLDRGAELNKADKYGCIPLHLAAAHDVVQLLLDRGADPNKANNDGWTPLHLAVYKGRKEAVELLLEGGAEPNRTNIDGWTPLHVASYRGGPQDVVQLLLGRGADANKAANDNAGSTPLSLALSEGHTDIANMLKHL